MCLHLVIKSEFIQQIYFVQGILHDFDMSIIALALFFFERGIFPLISNSILLTFHGMSTFVANLMPNLFSYIKTILFQPIQFNISTQFSSI